MLYMKMLFQETIELVSVLLNPVPEKVICEEELEVPAFLRVNF